MAALSTTAQCRLTDWMALIGFDLGQIPRLQVGLHHERTVLVTPVEAHARVPVSPESAACAIATIGNPSSPGASRRPIGEPYLYAKIGAVNNPIFPELLPGSIVRIDTRDKGLAGFSIDANSGPIYLVERVGGLTCCRVKRLDDRHILLLSRQSPPTPFPLRLGEEARILGKVET